ncbi:MAG: 2-hydroxyacyl-CoA dehydratase family protein [Myxococcota bacterium]|nr:2-hydroxyacyl-CoA dehydratase family protein [Myxococcota bacterium]
MADEKKKLGFKKIAATRMMKQVMANHFYDLDAAAKSGAPKVAWCTSVGPAELLRAMGFLVYFPENHGAMLGATRTAMGYISQANAAGYSPDICSYLTSDVGAFLKGETPISKAYDGITEVPKPDVLVYNTNQCRDVKDWFMWYGRRLGVPCIGVESFCNVDEVTETHVKTISAQIKNLVPTLEAVSGEKFDIDKLKEAVRLSRRCSELWEETLKTSAATPSPFTFFDAVIHMGPAVVARGTQEAVDYYEHLLSELKQRITDGVGAVEGERFRLYWEGMPVWGKLRDLSTLFLDQQTCVVASTYCNSWIFAAFDPDNPFDSMARAYTELFIVRSDRAKEDYIGRMIECYDVDGIIFHDAKTCPNNSNCRYGMHRRVTEDKGVPHVVINGDLNDLRLYSEEQTVTQLEAFIEQLGGR